MINLDKYVDKIITIFQDEQFGFTVNPDEIKSKSLRHHLKSLLEWNVLNQLCHDFLNNISQYSRCPYCGCTNIQIHVLDKDRYFEDIDSEQREGNITKRADAECRCCKKKFDVILDWDKGVFSYRKKEDC